MPPAPPDWSNKVFFDTVHFPQSLERFSWRGKGIYLIRGKVVLDMGFPSVEVDWMDKLA